MVAVFVVNVRVLTGELVAGTIPSGTELHSFVDCVARRTGLLESRSILENTGDATCIHLDDRPEVCISGRWICSGDVKFSATNYDRFKPALN